MVRPSWNTINRPHRRIRVALFHPAGCLSPSGLRDRALIAEPGTVLLPAEMALPRTFVGFSSTDIKYYHLMCAWKAHEHIDFNFADFQLDESINSENEYYIKSVCRNRIRLSDTYVLLIGADTWTKTTYVQWEVEVAIEKGCRLIGVNVNNSRFKDVWCPSFFCNKGALFVPFSPQIVAKALEPWLRTAPNPQFPDDWFFYDATYVGLGYQLTGSSAVMPPKVNPFLLGRPSWAK